MLVRGRQAILVTIAAAALVTTASACAGTARPAASAPAPSARPTGNPLEALSSYQIIRKAFVNTRKSLNVEITGQITRDGQITRLASLAVLDGSSACVGDVYQYGTGTFQLINDGSTVWVLPSLDYWKNAGAIHTSVRPRLTGKYLQLKAGASGLGALTGLCSIAALAGSGPNPQRRTGFSPPMPTMVGGLRALKILDTADGGYAIVSDTVTPRLLAFYVPGDNGSSFTLDYSGVPVTIAAPPGNEVIDGTPYGL